MLHNFFGPAPCPTMAPLCNELQDMIIDFLHDDPRTLRRCALLCKSWLPSLRFHRFSHAANVRNGHSPISWACKFQLEHLARVLLSRDDLDVSLWNEESSHHPLRYVAMNGNATLAKLLLARRGVGVNVECGSYRSDHLLTPL